MVREFLPEATYPSLEGFGRTGLTLTVSYGERF